MADTVSDQLAWETRAGRVAAGAAVLAAIFFVAGGVFLQLAIERPPSGSNELVARIGRDSTEYVLAGVISALASILLGVVLAYLYRAARFRRGQLPSATIALAIFGVVSAAAVAIARPLDLAAAAGDFPSAALRAEDSTEALLRDRTSLQIIGGVGLAANLALALAFVLLSVNAIRTGLLSRFLGVLGIVIGVLLPLVGPMPVLLFFWLGALAVLFLNRWPGGRGPAWETGEAVAWPTVAQRNAELDRRRSGDDGDEDDDRGEDEGEDTGAAAPADPSAGERDDARDDDADAEHRPGNGGLPAARRAKRKRGRRD